MVVNIQDDILRLDALGLFGRLLGDKATGGRILWATEAYAAGGPLYQPGAEIRAGLLTGENAGLLKTRARRAMEERTARTRRHGEVFTPLWVVKKMLDKADEVWFGRREGFSRLTEEGKVRFTRKRSWQRYVDARRMELTCGEAPFLATRYDVETGEALPVPARLGLLDRKLRAVSENAADREEWKRWAKRALEATYGYELAGDNLVIARVNLLLSVEEHYLARWGEKPEAAWLGRLTNTIVWNLWQMNGLTGRIPVPPRPEAEQLSLFASAELAQPPAPCRLRDWRSGRTHDYQALRKEGEKKMKFDFIIGNPPYQEETTDTISATNGQKPRTNIFHYFQLQADDIAEKGVALVYPAIRWMHRSGKGMADFGFKQINDPTLSEIIFFPDAREVFPGVEIADGISIVLKNKSKKDGGFKYTFSRNGKAVTIQEDNPGSELIALNPQDALILSKVSDFVHQNSLHYMHDGILPRTLFGIESNYVEEHPGILKPYNPGDAVDYSKEIKVFTNDKAGKAGRARWFTGPISIVDHNTELISEYQVVVSSANAGGQKRDNQLEIIDNHSVFGRSRVA
ncbi:MAG: Eco57I restriction-modification methylase domain-containing protein, partial [bacterium]